MHSRITDDATPCNGSPSTATQQSYYQGAVSAIQLMLRHLDEPLPLEVLAGQAMLSRFHFSRVFRSICGVPPARFLYAVRLQHAKRLLVITRRSILNVCYDIGYNSPGTFAARFSRLVGVPPGRLRSRARRLRSLELQCQCKSLANHDAEIQFRLLGGEISIDQAFEGFIFVGLFNSPVPQEIPAACAVLSGPGRYQLGEVRDGCYHLLAVGIRSSDDPLNFVLLDDSPRGRGGPILIRSSRVVSCTLDVRLRPPDITDPPILLDLTRLLNRPSIESACDNTLIAE